MKQIKLKIETSKKVTVNHLYQVAIGGWFLGLLLGLAIGFL